MWGMGILWLRCYTDRVFELLTSFGGGLCKEQIMVGSGMLLPPLGDSDPTPFDTADAETFEYLKRRQH